MPLGLLDCERSVMEDRGSKYGTGMSELHPLDQMIERANTPRGDDRHRNGIRNGPRQIEVEADLGAIAVHRGEENFAGTQLHHLSGIGNGIEPSWVPTAMREYFPARGGERIGHLLGVDRDHDALGAE